MHHSGIFARSHHTEEDLVSQAIERLFGRDTHDRLLAALRSGTQADLAALLAALRRIRVFDPACGSGNLLACSLDVLIAPERAVCLFLDVDPEITPAIPAGIEIHPKAAWTARECRPGADSVVGDSLATDWASVVETRPGTYIVGNPPFPGTNGRNAEQNAAMSTVFEGKVQTWKTLDVSAA